MRRIATDGKMNATEVPGVGPGHGQTVRKARQILLMADIKDTAPMSRPATAFDRE